MIQYVGNLLALPWDMLVGLNSPKTMYRLFQQFLNRQSFSTFRLKYSESSEQDTPGGTNQLVQNILSIDVEEYFQGQQFEHLFGMDAWDRFESRLEIGLDKLLSVLDEGGVRGTFFFLGWNAKRRPDLVRRVFEAGHEIGCHGYNHRSVYDLTPDEFRAETDYSIKLLSDIIGTRILGYRAAAFTIVKRTLWALDILADLGIVYDASIFPIWRRRYGIPDSPRFRHVVRNGRGWKLHEFPASTVRLFGWNWPVAGGGYLRLYPYSVTHWAIQRINRESHPAITYVHTWEFDPYHPHVNEGPLLRFAHYQNTRSTEWKLRRLLQNFQFVPFRTLL